MQKIPAVSRLINEFVKLPTIGQKTAERLSLFILNRSKEDVFRLADSLIKIKEEICYCSQCNNIAQSDPCDICTNEKRDSTTICVVEEPHDVFAIEKAGAYKGVFHVLQGTLSPLDGVGPGDLQLVSLLNRVKNEAIKEVILATNPTVEGEATAMYTAKLLKPLNIKVTRIARGLPIGGDLEYADEATLMKSLEGRIEIV